MKHSLCSRRAMIAPRMSLFAGITVLTLAALSLIPAVTHAADFPYNSAYNGESSILTSSEQSSANSATLQYWRDWRSNFIVPFGSNSKRVLFQEPDGSSNDRTVSEGIGYGMLLAVYMNDSGDRAVFDDLFQYYKDHLNSNGLMKYKLLSDGTPTSDGTGDASDADEDVAAALIFANKKWGDTGRWNYTTEAKRIIGQIKYWDVENNYTFNPGSPFSQKRPNPSPAIIQFNPSYFSPAWYRLFGDFTNDQTFWNNVISKGYQILYTARNANTGLVPHSCDDSGGIYGGYTYDYTDYQYDAVRTPFRTNLDYAWFNNNDGKNIAGKIGAFYGTQVNSNKTAVYDTHIYAGRATDGTVRGQYGSRLFDGNAGIGFLANSDRTNARFMFDAIVANAGYDKTLYFDGAWSLLCRLFLTGNFPNLYGSLGTGPTNPTFSISNSVSPSTTVTTGSSVTVTATFNCTAGSLSNGKLGLRLYNSSGTEVNGTTKEPVSLNSGNSNTITWIFNAPATAGTYRLNGAVWNSDYSTTYKWVDLNTFTVSAASSAQYSFEDGTAQGWKLAWGTITGIGNSSDRAQAGSKSLKFTVAGSNQYSAINVDNPAIGAGKTVTLYVWIPTGSNISAIKPILYNASYQEAASSYNTNLTGGAWNKVTVTNPSNNSTVKSLTVQVERSSTSGSWNCYLDSVSW